MHIIVKAKKTGIVEKEMGKCPTMRQGKGRPKRNLLSTLRTKAWANYCAIRVGVDKHASSGAIAKAILPQKKDLDSGRQASLAATWRKYLNRTSGVSEGNVDLLDKLWPGSGKNFNFGLFAKESKYIGDFNFPEAGGHVPLWAALKGDNFRTRKDNSEKQPFLRDFWRNISPYSWFLWSPWNLPYDLDEFYNFENNHILRNDGNWEELPLMTAVVNGNTHQYSMTNQSWYPTNKNFRDDDALVDFLHYYAYNPACYPETSALLCLTACISISRLCDKPLCVLPPLFSFEELASELHIYNICFEDIVTSACELGLTILSTYEKQLLIEGNKELARQNRDQLEHRDRKAFQESLKIREANRSQNQTFEYFSIDHRRPNT